MLTGWRTASHPFDLVGFLFSTIISLIYAAFFIFLGCFIARLQYRRIATFVLIGGWFVLAVHFFNAPTTNLRVDYHSGFPALLEQATLSLMLPAVRCSDYLLHAIPRLLFGSAWHTQHYNSVSACGQLSRILFCVFSLWPVVALCFRPWHELPLRFRRCVAVYSFLYLVGACVLFFQLRATWQWRFH